MEISKYKIVPLFIILLTLCLPLVHFNPSRIYNYQVALLQLGIVFITLAIYRTHFLASLPIKSIDFWLVIGFLFFAFLSTIGSDHLRHGFERYISILIWISYLWVLIFLFRRGDLRHSLMVQVVALSCLVPILLIIFELLTKGDDFKNFWQVSDSLYHYSNIRHFGYHLTISIVFGYFFLLDNSIKKTSFYLGLILLLLFLIVLVWSGSRQGIVVSFFSGGLLLFLYFKMPIRYILLALICSSLLLTLIIYLLSGSNVLFAMYDRFTSAGLNLDAILASRVSIWSSSIEKLQGNWLLGHGADAFNHIKTDEFGSFSQPHSVFIQSLIEWGLIGSLFYFSLLGRIIYKAIKILDFLHFKRNSPSLIIASTSIGAMLLNSVIDGIFYHVLPIYMFSIFRSNDNFIST